MENLYNVKQESFEGSWHWICKKKDFQEQTE
jgi:hypothetical protein